MGCVKTKTTITCNKENKKNNNDELHYEKKSPDNKLDLDSNSKTNNASNKKNIINYNEINNKTQNKLLKDASEIDNLYFILEKISKNPISQNYKIQNKKNPSIFKTMKVLTKSTMEENDEELKIIQEIEILKGLKHENVIEIEQCYSDEKFFYIISEYSDYGSLKDQFGIKKKYSENQTKYIMYQLLKAIKYLNKNNFIHTDIKPENILISEKIIINKEELFKVKLVDFGNANSLQNPESKNLPYYVAPEVIDRKFNEKCDIWSLGIIMFRLLFGYVPFKGTSFDEVINNIKNSPIEYDKEDEYKHISLSENGEDILSKMIVREVDKRFDVDSCINHKWFKYNNLSIIEEEEKEKRYDVSPTYIENRYTNTILLKTKFNKKDEDNIVNTGFYRMGSNIIESPKKLQTVIQLPEDNYHFFLTILKKFILFFYRIYFQLNEEENIIRDIYQKKENRDLSKISVKDVYDCTIEYAGMINFSVRYIVFKEQIKDDIKEYFNNESFINFNSFKEFLITEKENSIDIEFSNCFDKLIKKNKEEIEMCLDLDNSTKGKTNKYFILIKKELENKVYTYDEFKTIVKDIITKFNQNDEYIDKSSSSMNFSDEKNENKEEKKEFEIELNDNSKNMIRDNDLLGIVNITKKKCSQNSDTLKSKSQLIPIRENTRKSKSSYNPKRDPNAFDPEKFLLLVDENYNYKNGN
jgi:serine/threonine protein kinase